MTNVAETLNGTQKRAVIAAIEKLKLLDPAVGSGAFPMGALQSLVALLQKIDPNNQLWREQLEKSARALTVGSEGALEQIAEVWRRDGGDYARKLYLIENCLFGVDIQPIAIQIAKLRFFIALAIEQKGNDNRADNFGIRPLPNLETKLVAANTLLELHKSGDVPISSAETVRLQGELENVRAAHFKAQKWAKKKQLRDDDKRLRGELAHELEDIGMAGGAAELLAHWNPYDQNASAPFFDPRWMFGLEHGFDVVIGNPPYGAELSTDQKNHLKIKFSHIVQRIPNSYIYFVGAAYGFLRKNGVVVYVIPNEFLFQIYMTKAREFLLKESQVLFAVNVGESVFDAIVPTCILGLRKNTIQDYAISVADLRQFGGIELSEKLDTSRFVQVSSSSILSTPNAMFSFDIEKSALVSKLSTRFPSFENFCSDIANGISTSCDSVYIVSSAFAKEKEFEEDYLRPCIRGGQFNRYLCPLDTSEVVIYINGDFQKSDDANIYEYLHGNKELLIRKCVEKRKGNRFWATLFRSRYEDLFLAPKILVRQTADRIVATLDETKGYYCIDSVNVVQLKSEYVSQRYWLLGVLNSRALHFFYREISQEHGRVLAQVKPQRVKALPIPAATPAQQAEISGLVEAILAARAADVAADVTALEAQIDALVYALYGLSDDEIALVEAA